MKSIPNRHDPDTTGMSDEVWQAHSLTLLHTQKGGQRPTNISCQRDSSFSDSSWVLSHRLWATLAASEHSATDWPSQLQQTEIGRQPTLSSSEQCLQLTGMPFLKL